MSLVTLKRVKRGRMGSNANICPQNGKESPNEINAIFCMLSLSLYPGSLNQGCIKMDGRPFIRFSFDNNTTLWVSVIIESGKFKAL